VGSAVKLQPAALWFSAALSRLPRAFWFLRFIRMNLGYIHAEMKLVAAFSIWIGIATAWAGAMPPVQTVFVIVLENHDWSDFKRNTNAPFLNGTLLPMASQLAQLSLAGSGHEFRDFR
jgi:hypothetical protein